MPFVSPQKNNGVCVGSRHRLCPPVSHEATPSSPPLPFLPFVSLLLLTGVQGKILELRMLVREYYSILDISVNKILPPLASLFLPPQESFFRDAIFASQGVPLATPWGEQVPRSLEQGSVCVFRRRVSNSSLSACIRPSRPYIASMRDVLSAV